MCRHLAYVGAPVSLADLLVTPAARPAAAVLGTRGAVRTGSSTRTASASGGTPTATRRPARYRRAVPMWTDPSFLDVARVTSSRAVLAAVRSATVGTSLDESAAAPYGKAAGCSATTGGSDGWPDAVAALAADAAGRPAARPRGPRRLGTAVGDDAGAPRCGRLARAGRRRGWSPTSALSRRDGSTCCVTDGTRIVATAAGDTLCWRSTALGTVVASEPSDDDPGWNRVPDGILLTATRDHVDVAALLESSRRRPSRRDRPHRDHRTTFPRPRRAQPAPGRPRRTDGDAQDAAPQVVLRQGGSELFEQITTLPEYYPTRAEREILRAAGR